MRRFRAPRQADLRAAAAHLSHLPVMERIFHPKSRRPLYASCAGVCIMLTASATACEAEHISHALHMNHVLIDAAAYFFHGVGSIPLIRYFEFFWRVILGD